MKQTKNVAEIKGLSAIEREQIAKAIERADKRAAYQKKRNARPEVKAARTAYNRKRYNQQKALMAKARELGLVK
jgi:hypothetical protein